MFAYSLSVFQQINYKGEFGRVKFPIQITEAVVHESIKDNSRMFCRGLLGEDPPHPQPQIPSHFSALTQIFTFNHVSSPPVKSIVPPKAVVWIKH